MIRVILNDSVFLADKMVFNEKKRKLIFYSNNKKVFNVKYKFEDFKYCYDLLEDVIINLKKPNNTVITLDLRGSGRVLIK